MLLLSGMNRPMNANFWGKTVVLADGLAGVDALAAGWWTSYWQTPIVLHNGTDSLPLVTRNALLTTSIENVIILEGQSVYRIK